VQCERAFVCNRQIAPFCVESAVPKCTASLTAGFKSEVFAWKKVHSYRYLRLWSDRGIGRRRSNFQFSGDRKIPLRSIDRPSAREGGKQPSGCLFLLKESSLQGVGVEQAFSYVR
jgi:hypothetical protein